ncbi:MAG: hypothetical protein J7M03_00070 [Candidatus Desulfofervidaceae bacterium]|nr:hypothetical protein [Candidatus Desulfofervidaceae bacterium]MDL1971039.1 hypothetical protein [Candidatus Desulfofervidaceae bacterium]
MNDVLDTQTDKVLSKLFHQLRTPLNSILGFTELLKKETYGPLTPKQKEFLEIIHRNAQNLLDLMTQAFEKIEVQKKEKHTC